MFSHTMALALIYSNPQLFSNQVSHAMVSHVDFLPTLASLFDVPQKARAAWEGIDYSQIVLNPKAKPVQKYIAFTYDDYQSGQPNPPHPGPMNHIVSIREERYKLAKYHDVNYPLGTCQWEMYDLLTDPLETRNLGLGGTQTNSEASTGIHASQAPVGCRHPKTSAAAHAGRARDCRRFIKSAETSCSF